MKDKNRDDYFEKQKPSFLRSVGGLITFTTIIPINIFTTIEESAKVTWTFPIINCIIGIIGATIAYLLMIFHLDSLLIATILYGFFISINGFNHFDGLMDFGDGIMVHGSPEKKLNIMRDPITGVGGISTAFIVGTITIAALNSIISSSYSNIYILLAIIIAEMSAKIGLISCCVSSKSSEDGIGKYFINSMTLSKYILAIIISLIIASGISFKIGILIGILGIIGGIFGGAISSKIAKKHLKIANGDVLGTSNELGRLFSLILMTIGISNFLI